MRIWITYNIPKGRRQAFNNAIQFTGADSVQKIALTKFARFREFNIKFTVFDSFLIEVPIDITEERVNEVLGKVSKMGDLKLNYKYAFGSNWKEVQEKA